MEQIPHIGGSRIKRDSVIFDFDRGGAEAIVAHAKSPELRAAAVAATYITKRGKLIAGQKNHEGNKTTTLTFAAPVIINGESAHVGVVIQFTRNGRPHAVNIEAVDPTTGEATVFKLKEAAKGLDRRSTKSMVTVLPTIAASDNNLPQSNGKSKPYYEKKSSRPSLPLGKSEKPSKTAKNTAMEGFLYSFERGRDLTIMYQHMY